MSLGKGDLQEVAHQWTRSLLLHAKVDDGATASTVPLVGVDCAFNQWAGRWLHVLTGPARGSWRRIAANDATVLLLEAELLATPQAGDEVAILESRPAATVYRVLPRTALPAGGSALVWTPAAGMRVRLLSFHVTVSAATVLTLSLGPEVIWERDFAAAGGADVLLPADGILGTVDGALSVTSSAPATVGVTAIGVEE